MGSIAVSSIVLINLSKTAESFVPSTSIQRREPSAVYGYLDDISKYTANPEAEEEEIDDSVEANNLAREKKDRFGVGDWKDFKDFEEFDGGDGQMGVAGDGNKGLEK